MRQALEVQGAVRCDRAEDIWSVIEQLLEWQTNFPAWQAVTWSLPRAGPITPPEAEQVLGLVASVGRIEIDDVIRLHGYLRPERLCFALRWSVADLAHDGLVEQFLAAMEQVPVALQSALHLIDVRPGDEIDSLWRHNVDLIAGAAVHGHRPPIFGVVVPLPSEEDTAPAVDALREILDGYQLDERLLAQRVRGPIEVRDSFEVLGFASAQRLSVDLSTSLASGGYGWLRPYETHGAYVPQPFDIRAPAQNAHGCTIEFPRRDGSETLRAAADLGAAGISAAVFDSERRRRINRLRLIFDRRSQAEYQRLVNVDTTRTQEWADHFVYNWSPPPTHFLACVEFDASDLGDVASPLRLACDSGLLSDLDPRLAPASEVVELANEQARRQRKAVRTAHLEDQVAGHAYLGLGGRADISGDSRRLLDLVPRTGRMLEIGCGFGVLAAHIADLAETYVGVDLLLEQGVAARSAGVRPAVADMHHLPFREGTFDVILADNVLEHSYAPLAVLSEVRRLLRPDGVLLAVIPPDLATSDFSLPLHLWKTDREGLASALAAASMHVDDVQEVTYARVGAPGAFPASCGKTLLVQASPSISADERPDKRY